MTLESEEGLRYSVPVNSAIMAARAGHPDSGEIHEMLRRAHHLETETIRHGMSNKRRKLFCQSFFLMTTKNKTSLRNRSRSQEKESQL